MVFLVKLEQTLVLLLLDIGVHARGTRFNIFGRPLQGPKGCQNDPKGFVSVFTTYPSVRTWCLNSGYTFEKKGMAQAEGLAKTDDDAGDCGGALAS